MANENETLSQEMSRFRGSVEARLANLERIVSYIKDVQNGDCVKVDDRLDELRHRIVQLELGVSRLKAFAAGLSLAASFLASVVTMLIKVFMHS
jgi:hypothetical protein